MSKKNRQHQFARSLHDAFALHQAGRLEEAWKAYARILAVDPTMPDALHLSACIALERGDAADAARRIERALAAVGANPAFLTSLGNALTELNRHAEAEERYRQALALDPRSSPAYNNLGNLLLRLGRDDEAIAAFDQAVVHQPNHVNALLALGRLLAGREATDIAVQLLLRAHSVAPRDERVLTELARVNFRSRHYDRAMQALETMRQLAPDSADVFSNIGEVLRTIGRFSDAAEHYRHSLRLRPHDSTATNGLTLALNRLGRTAEAVQLIRDHLQVAPDNVSGHSNLVFLLNNLSDVSPEELFAEHRAWNARHAVPLGRPAGAMANDKAPDRLLRVGYVSADYCAHSVAFFIEPLLERHDRSQFDVFAYYTGARVDRVTQRLKSLPLHWRDVAAMSDEALAGLIRADRIDLLIDLSGHTGNNRLLTFARQPAPVQISYLGYPHSTGLDAIQYRISDARADPPGIAEAFSSEALLRLPDCFHCYRPAADDGDPHFRPPSADSGQIVFGSFNVLSKLNPPVIAAWSRILARVEGSRLLLKTSGLDDGGAHASLLAAFADHGITAERLILASHQTAHTEHLLRYREIDIALDPFPYNGTTTTCDALWMGVPVITRRADRHAGRVGASLLHAVGLDEWIADDVDSYIELAVRLAGNPTQLAELHASLRRRLRASPLMDEARFVRNFETALRDAWTRYCRPAPVAAAAPAAPTSGERRLHIGGRHPAPGWELMNAIPGPGVDHPGNANDLSRFADASFDRVYASHVLEHLDYNGELPRALGEWLRVLKPGGELAVSVPDLEVLAGIILDRTLTPADRFWAMGMIFGGHRDAYDYHQVGLTEEFLRRYLSHAGAVDIERVESFALFDDASEITHAGRRISLNMRCRKPAVSASVAAAHWSLRIAGDVRIHVPADYTALTPYVLLEQEDWFEDEIRFLRRWLQPGMQVIDIGANYGVYTLAAARRVGPGGRVWSFEPVDRTRGFLARSVADNGFAQVELIAAAVSDQVGEAWISLNANPELDRLGAATEGGPASQRTPTLTLDAWLEAHPQASLDLVKIDAEGHEGAVLEGGRSFFTSRSPLVMFEIRDAQTVNHRLIDDVRALGYAVFRLLPGLDVLAPVDPDEALDPFVLNLFACKPDRADKLCAAGWLVGAAIEPPALPQDGLAALAALPCFAARKPAWTQVPDPDLMAMLDAYALTQQAGATARCRYDALAQALVHARRACQRARSVTRLHSLARIAAMAGQRHEAVQALGDALAMLDAGAAGPATEPFLPASSRFDQIPFDVPSKWLEAATLERLLELRALSGYFVDPEAERRLVQRSAALRLHSPQTERRRQLLDLRSGSAIRRECSPSLAAQTTDNLNPQFWCVDSEVL